MSPKTGDNIAGKGMYGHKKKVGPSMTFRGCGNNEAEIHLYFKKFSG